MVAMAELIGMFAWTSELLQTKHATFRRPEVNVIRLVDAKEWSVMSRSAGVVGSAKKFGPFSAKKTAFFVVKSCAFFRDGGDLDAEEKAMNAWNSSMVWRNAWFDLSCIVLTRTMSSDSNWYLRKLTVLFASSVLLPSMTKRKSLRKTPRYGTMHSVPVATKARSAAHFLSTEQSCRTPSKPILQPHERLHRPPARSRSARRARSGTWAH